MKRVGIVSNNKFQNKIEEDLNLKNALKEDGINADIISWENIDNNYYLYDCLVVRSIWGYHNNYIKFKKWLETIKNIGVPIYNSIDMIENNIRKDLQFKILDKNKIAHVDTIFQKNNIDFSKINSGMVVKPIISGSGGCTYISENIDHKRIVDIMNIEDNGIMVQPYEKSIENGEFSIIYIDGENTHNMIRYPGIMYDKKKPCEIKNPPNDIIKLAEKVRNIPDYMEALYMRVDIIDIDNPKVMEVELTEPDLLTRNIRSDIPIRKLSKGIRRRL